MTADRSKCPACGEPVYPSDDVCMSCGAELRKPAPVPEPPPPAAPSGPQAPAAAPRAPIVKPWYHRVVESCGRLWDIYPWIGIGIIVVGGLILALGVPVAVQYTIAGAYVVWDWVFLFWLICDVLYFDNERWWIIVCLFCCYPFGLLLYLWKGR